jgi:hypothetical protein
VSSRLCSGSTGSLADGEGEGDGDGKDKDEDEDEDDGAAVTAAAASGPGLADWLVSGGVTLLPLSPRWKVSGGRCHQGIAGLAPTAKPGDQREDRPARGHDGSACICELTSRPVNDNVSKT